MENETRKGTKGKIFVVNEYKLMKKGVYQKMGNPLALSLDLKNVPLEMYEARNALDIAKSRKADQYAPEIFTKAEASLKMAENALAGKKNQKEIISTARDPPLVLWSLSRRSASLPAFEGSERYSVNVLAADQVDLARRFSRPHADRFEGVSYRLGWAGAPLIDGCVAWIECSHHARHRAGDHVVFIGDVQDCARGEGRGLVFHEHRYATTASLEK